MRKIITSTFVTLDGVIQGPGGPQEDSTNDFKWGGWSANYWDETMEQHMASNLKEEYDLLLGRKTYEIFAAHWPFVKNDPIGDNMNNTTKYVVSHQSIDLTWQRSILISGDVVENLKKLKQEEGKDLFVHGSAKLIQTLLSNELVDISHIWIFPLTIGKGKRLFADGTLPKGMKLSNSKISSTGVIMTTYLPAGEIPLGSFALEQPSNLEIKRREKWRNEK